jgi:hypothetical protein
MRGTQPPSLRYPLPTLETALATTSVRTPVLMGSVRKHQASVPFGAGERRMPGVACSRFDVVHVDQEHHSPTYLLFRFCRAGCVFGLGLGLAVGWRTDWWGWLAITEIGRHLRDLRSLDLSQATTFNDLGAIAVARVRVGYCSSLLFSGSSSHLTPSPQGCPHLEMVGVGGGHMFSDSSITDGTLMALARHCPRLRVVNMLHCVGYATCTLPSIYLLLGGLRLLVCVCVCVCVRARARACFFTGSPKRAFSLFTKLPRISRYARLGLGVCSERDLIALPPPKRVIALRAGV